VSHWCNLYSLASSQVWGRCPCPFTWGWICWPHFQPIESSWGEQFFWRSLFTFLTSNIIYFRPTWMWYLFRSRKQFSIFTSQLLRYSGASCTLWLHHTMTPTVAQGSPRKCLWMLGKTSLSLVTSYFNAFDNCSNVEISKRCKLMLCR